VQDAGAIAASLTQIDTHVRHMNQTARNTDKIDALVVDELVLIVDEICVAMKRIEDVVCKCRRENGGKREGEEKRWVFLF